MQNKTLVIVPAKGISLRLSNKNLLLIKNKPLFLHSCEYSKSEGFTNIVVSSDSDEILEIASKEGYMTHKENVDETRLENCVNQILNIFIGYDSFIVLQPTSPLRELGYLSKCSRQLNNCIISAQKIKPIAFFKGEPLFNPDNRVLAQDCRDWIYHFDGSVIIRNTLDYLKTNLLIKTDCLTIENNFPFYLQIDDVIEYNIIKQIMET